VSVSQPVGYRIPSQVGLTTLSRVLTKHGKVIRRDEATRVVAAVVADFYTTGDPDEVIGRLSHGQLSAADLVVSAATGSDLIRQAAEFIDLLHAQMHHLSALPMPAHLDLRFCLQFYDDRDDPNGRWTYVLLGTNCDVLEQAWQRVNGVEQFAVTTSDDPGKARGTDPEWAQRAATWERVTRPFRSSSPITWSAPEPELLFAVTESLREPAEDVTRADAGELTVTMIIDEVGRQLAGVAGVDLATLTNELLAVQGREATAL
jgi:hypothetical protein